MLPLYTELKVKLEQLLVDLARRAADRQLGPFAATGRVRQHEGNRIEYMTIDGAWKATDYQRMTVDLEIQPSDIRTMTFDNVVQLMTKQGLELGAQEASFYFKVLNQSIEEVGNSIDAGGQQLTVDLLLQMLDRVQLAFDATGSALLPTLHVGPDIAASVERVLKQVNEDPDAQARLRTLIDKKREEWNAEQDRRKLVD
jgi:hypothetical protein